eukprot:Sdes_comp19109_c0_seq1m9803
MEIVSNLKLQLDGLSQKESNTYSVEQCHILSGIISLLENQPMTLEILQETRIGKCVNTLRRNTTDKNLASRAKKLVKKWSSIVSSQASLPVSGAPSPGDYYKFMSSTPQSAVPHSIVLENAVKDHQDSPNSGASSSASSKVNSLKSSPIPAFMPLHKENLTSLTCPPHLSQNSLLNSAQPSILPSSASSLISTPPSSLPQSSSSLISKDAPPSTMVVSCNQQSLSPHASTTQMQLGGAPSLVGRSLKRKCSPQPAQDSAITFEASPYDPSRKWLGVDGVLDENGGFQSWPESFPSPCGGFHIGPYTFFRRK